MGFYIEVPSKRGKVQQLKDLHGAVVIQRPVRLREIPSDKMLVCVVENPEFDAAGLAYDDEEMLRFASGAYGRQMTWMVIDKAVVKELKPHLAACIDGHESWRD